jgi:hypothetical protein
MRKLQVAATLAFVLGALASCGKGTAAAPKAFADAKRGIQFQYPADWTVEELAQQNVLVVSSPIQEANWQTNVFVELRTDDAPELPIEQRLGTLAENLGKFKQSFVLISSKPVSHPSGVAAGELRYTHVTQGVPLTDRELVLWLAPGKTLFVTGSAVTSLWPKYEADLNTILDSVTAQE